MFLSTDIWVTASVFKIILFQYILSLLLGIISEEKDASGP